MGDLMTRILSKAKLGDDLYEFQLQAPKIARACQPGQFIIFRLHEKGERIPVTIADTNLDLGSISVVVQGVGKTTMELNRDYETGDDIRDVVGPLGNPSEIDTYGRVVAIGGGVGIAIIFPIVKALKEAGNEVISILGAQTENKLFYRDKIARTSDRVIVTTDDGSAGRKGFTTDAFKEVLGSQKVDMSWAIGPVVMMKYCTQIAEEFDTEIIVSLNSIMVDGTGMCGGCRVTVGSESKFACVDGPEFVGSQVDFELLSQRTETYRDKEECALEQFVEKESRDG